MLFNKRFLPGSGVCRSKLKKDRYTKNLIPRLQAGEIALISHADLDELAVRGLLKARVLAVINTSQFVTGRFVNYAPGALLEAGLFLLEEVDEDIFHKIEDGDMVTIDGERVLLGSEVIGLGRKFTSEIWEQRMETARRQAGKVARNFFENTLDHASREKELLLEPVETPYLKTSMYGKDVVIVVRGRNYREDLRIIRNYLQEVSPVLIGVDGGADALWEEGFCPHLVIGDMDSVSDLVLKRAGEIVVHTYPDGRETQGLKRVKALGVEYCTFKAPGTSEDIAMLLAYEKGAELIVALGAHFGVAEFLEKGRRGMSSTLLVRLKVGDRLVDAKGVSRLYRKPHSPLIICVLILAGILPVVVLLLLSPLVQHFFQVLIWRMGFAP